MIFAIAAFAEKIEPGDGDMQQTFVSNISYCNAIYLQIKREIVTVTYTSTQYSVSSSLHISAFCLLKTLS